MTYFVAIDVGTQGTKGCVVDENGVYVATAFEESHLIYGAAGQVEQDPNEILNSVIAVIREVVQASTVSPQDICAICVDGQMAGIMGIDEDFCAVTPYDSWLDTRCEPQIAQMKAQAGKEIISMTGCPVTYAHGPKILYWKQQRPDVFQQVQKFVTLTCFVTGKLAGLSAQAAYIDYTQLHFSGFGNVENLSWCEGLLQQFKIPMEKMPRIVAPWERVGTLTNAMAQRCGLSPDTVLVAGCGDQAATSLGAGIVSPGQAFDVAGTASVFSCCVENYQPDLESETIIFARSVVPQQWIPLAYINGGGMCLKWFVQDILGGNNQQYPKMDSQSEAVQRGSEGLLFVPHFSGRVCPNTAKIKGAWLGLAWNHTSSHMFRAIMESIGFEYSLYLNRICALVPQFQCNTVTVIGGGAKSDVFNRIKSEILGVDYITMQQSNAALRGCAIIAGHALGIYEDIAKTAAEFAKSDYKIHANTKAFDAYKPYKERYARALEAFTIFYQENY